MAGKQVTELDTLPSFTDTSLVPVHNGAGLKKGTLTQLSNYLGTKFSNPNLLINPDFKINQRGNTTYTKDNQGPAIYTVDRWVVWNATLNANSMLLKAYDSGSGLLMQRLESKINGISTVSFEVSSISGTLTALARGTSGNILGEISVTQKGIYQFTANGEISDITFKISASGSVTFAWAKLEQGSIATPFVAPNPAEELVKCRRYFIRLPASLIAYGLNTFLFVSVPEVMNMRNNITVGSIGSGSDNFIRYQGTSKKISVDVPKCEASTMNGYVKIITSPSTNEADSRIVSLGFNDFFITLDAEIY